MRKNRIRFLFLLIVAVIFRYNFGGFIPSLLFNTLISLLIFSIGYTLYIYIRFKFVQDIDKRVIIKGERIHLSVKLSNEDFIIYPYIYVSFFGTHTLLNSTSYSQGLALSPLSKREFVFDMECKYRGQYEIGLSDIYIEDFLGLIRLNYQIPDTKKITVFPKIEHLEKFDVFANNNFDSQNMSQGTVEDITNIRDMRNYQYGDSFRRIHWKLSARNNSLMVKNYQLTSEATVNILLDLRKNSYSEDINIVFEDKIIETAVAVLNYYVSKNVTVNYVYFNEKIETLKAANKLEFDTIYKALSTISFKQKASLSDIIDVYYETSANSSDLIIFTSILDVELYNSIYKAQMSNHSICLVYISPKSLVNKKFEMVDDILDNLPEIGVRAFTINPEDDIKMILGG